MQTIGLVLVIIGIIILGWKALEVRKATRTSPGYPKKMAIFYLFSAFVVLVGITSVFAEAIFEFLGLEKPAQLEWMGLIAYIVFCAATVLIFKVEPTKGTGLEQPGPKADTIVKQGDTHVHNYGKVEKQVNDSIIKGDLNM